MPSYEWNLCNEPAYRDTSLPLAERLDGVKYVCWEDPRRGACIILFWRREMHSDIVSRKGRGEVLGAGFVRNLDGRLICHGYSESLDVHARPEDQALLDAWIAEKFPAEAQAPQEPEKQDAMLAGYRG